MMDKNNKDKMVQIVLSDEVRKSFEQIAEGFEIQEILSESLHELNKSINNPLAELIKDINTNFFIPWSSIIDQQNEIFKKIVDQYTLNNLSYLTEDINRITSAAFSIAHLPTINFGNYAHFYTREEVFQEIAEYELNKNIFEKILQYFEEKILAIPNGMVTAQGIFQLYQAILLTLTILIAFNQYKLNQQTSEELSAIRANQDDTNELLNNIDNLGEKVIPLIEDIAKSNSEEILFLVKKESPIRSQATADSDTLYRVFPNQLVKIISEEKRWFYVEFFDNKQAVPRMGYIYKGNVTEFDK